MGRHASRRAADSANRKINAAAWFYGQSFTSAHRDPQPRETYQCWNCGETAQTGTPHACDTTPEPDQSSTVVAQQLHRHLSATMPGLLHCESCGRHVFTLVEGRCFQCGRPKRTGR